MRIVDVLKDAYRRFSANNAGTRGAAIAFYTVTSMAPILLIVIAVAGAIFGADAARGAIVAQFSGLIGPNGADLLEKTIASASRPTAGIVASVIGIGTLIATASGVFIELEEALSAILEAKRDTSGLSAFVRARIASFGLVVALGFLLLVSLVIDAALKAFSSYIDSLLPFGSAVLMGISFVLSFLLIGALFAAMYRILPAKPPPWRHVLFGAAITALLFEIGQKLIGLYLGSSSAASSLGAAGALLALLFWVYYSAQLFLFGAALTQAYFASTGAKIEPAKTERSSYAAQPSVDAGSPVHLQGIAHEGGLRRTAALGLLALASVFLRRR